MKPIDLFITAYLRPQFTLETIRYLKERTKYPYRLFLIHNGGNEEALIKYADDFFLVIDPSYNIGIHAAWNLALALAESEYFITSDNDIYVPELEPDWLTQLTGLMDERPDYGAISLHPHIIVGNVSEDPNDPEDVKEVDHCGAVMRIMKREAVWQAGGWEKWVRQGRNHEEKTISGRLQAKGYKVGRTTRLRAYHPFGKGIENQSGWGYPPEFPPELQGHNPDLVGEVLRYDQPEAYDPLTWLPKGV